MMLNREITLIHGHTIQKWVVVKRRRKCNAGAGSEDEGGVCYDSGVARSHFSGTESWSPWQAMLRSRTVRT